MRLSHSAESRIIASITPGAHLVLEGGRPTPGVYPYVRRDGALVVHRDGLQEFLHRRLYRLLIAADLGRSRLTRTCEVWGCANPYHFSRSLELEPGRHGACPKGHAYEGNTTPSGHCAICAAARAEARRARLALDAAVLNSMKAFCPFAHEYDEANTYVYVDSLGREHRRCRACSRDRSAARRRAAPRI